LVTLFSVISSDVWRLLLMDLVWLQEKYKLKKQKKYAPKVLLRRPSTRRYIKKYAKSFIYTVSCAQPDILTFMLLWYKCSQCSLQATREHDIFCTTIIKASSVALNKKMPWNISNWEIGCIETIVGVGDE